jgi:hypothetical protein
MINALNKLTKLFAITIFLVSLNTFSVVLDPLITISANHVSATSGTAITPVTITNRGVTYEQRYHIYLLNKQGFNQTFIAGSVALMG